MTMPDATFENLHDCGFNGKEPRVRHAMRRCYERYGIKIALAEYDRMSRIAAGKRVADSPHWTEEDGVPFYIGRADRRRRIKMKNCAYVEIYWRGMVFECVVSPRAILTFLPKGTFANHPWYFAIKQRG